jgi:hypothetical protein
MRVADFAEHHMRNHHDDIAIPSKMAFDARLGASDLAFDQYVQVSRINNMYVSSAQESPAMRVVDMGITAQTCNFP